MVFLALLLIVAALVFVLSQYLRIQDNREAYLRDRTGRALALLCAGPERNGGFDTPNHELILHDGASHQNPAVVERYRGRWPFGRRMQYRYYPLTRSVRGDLPDLFAFQARINRTRLRKHQVLALVPMDERIEQQANLQENITQRTRGVTSGNLKSDRKGRPR